MIRGIKTFVSEYILVPLSQHHLQGERTDSGSRVYGDQQQDKMK